MKNEYKNYQNRKKTKKIEVIKHYKKKIRYSPFQSVSTFASQASGLRSILSQSRLMLKGQ